MTGPLLKEMGCKGPHNSPLYPGSRFPGFLKVFLGSTSLGQEEHKEKGTNMSHRDGCQLAEKAGLAGSLVHEAQGAHHGIFRGREGN